MDNPLVRCSGRKSSHLRKRTLGEFTAVNTKYCGSINVRKHIEIKGRDK